MLATYNRTTALMMRDATVLMEPVETGDAQDDMLLMVRIARRDRRAFELFYDKHAPLALGVAMRILADRSMGEDVLQDAFWRVWERAPRFDVNGGNPRAWLLTIVHHLAIDHLRRGRRPSLELDAQEDDAMALPDHDADVHEHALRNIGSAEVRLALGGLDQKQRDVIELSYFQGLTHRQIAERLGQPAGTIHSRALQGIAALKRALQHWEAA